jgi:hypothetical protein
MQSKDSTKLRQSRSVTEECKPRSRFLKLRVLASRRLQLFTLKAFDNAAGWESVGNGADDMKVKHRLPGDKLIHRRQGEAKIAAMVVRSRVRKGTRKVIADQLAVVRKDWEANRETMTHQQQIETMILAGRAMKALARLSQ